MKTLHLALALSLSATIAVAQNFSPPPIPIPPMPKNPTASSPPAGVGANYKSNIPSNLQVQGNTTATAQKPER